ncbi:aminodeoxychorismate lyase [Pseudomonas sp. PS02288]|uniref:aminodeoxychorismate lyase n=1 Tax=Pseudomonas sp. PS02288 TaxID=2991443 RepID=UPI00249A6168|nr:aminodeoxychorismate lyase [Pseudomonas sp. PS02288]
MLRWVDGRPSETLSSLDRGLAYGDGLFETIAVHSARPRLLEHHLARLADGCRRLSIPLDQALLRAELLAFATQLGEGVAKLVVTRGDGARGYAPPGAPTPRRLLFGSPWPSYAQANVSQGVELFPCRTRLAEQPLLAGMKHLNRLEQVIARGEWQEPRYAEGLMRDMSGRVVEGVFSNLFLVREGRLITAELSRCGVAGVMRAWVLEQAAEQQIVVEIRDVDYDELLAADEVFLCNSLYGIWPVRRLEGHVWSAGALTRKLQGILRTLLDF